MSDESYTEYILGMECLRENNLDEALVHFRNSLKVDLHFKTCQRIAKILISVGRSDEAEEFIEQAFSLNPKHSQVATEYAALLSQHGKRDKAISILAQTITSNASYRPAKDLLASLKVTKDSEDDS